MVSKWLRFRNGEVMEVLAGLGAKSSLVISLCCPHLSGSAATPGSLTATGSVPPSLEQLLLR